MSQPLDRRGEQGLVLPQVLRDIVVEVGPGWVAAIGGNVDDSVTRSVFPLDARGVLSPISGRPVFTVIENRLP